MDADGEVDAIRSASSADAEADSGGTGFFLRFVFIKFQFGRCRNLTTTTIFKLSGFYFNLDFCIVT
jgi:hypothetical protein